MPNVKHYSKVLPKKCPHEFFDSQIDQFSRRPPLGDSATSAAQIKKKVNSWEICANACFDVFCNLRTSINEYLGKIHFFACVRV